MRQKTTFPDTPNPSSDALSPNPSKEEPHRPRILKLETGWHDPREQMNEKSMTVLDYQVYDSVPRFWAAFERLARLDVYLAWRARRLAADYDLVLAGSEKVAIPLTLMGVSTPLVVAVHYPQSRVRAWLLKYLRLADRWAAVGYVSPADREFLSTQLNVPEWRLFSIFGMELTRFVKGPPNPNGPILSLGVTNRDYPTLISALETLPGCETEIYASSRYGDRYRGGLPGSALPAWIHFCELIPDEELLSRYRSARFVVVPLKDTRQGSSGVSVILEASASGKAVIATRTPGSHAYLIDGETGILVPPHNVPALRAAIEKLSTQPDLARTLGDNGRRFVEQQFDVRTVHARIQAKLRQVYMNNLEAKP